VVSFNGNKVMTTSGGGMLLTDDGRLATHVKKLSTQAREPVSWYEHEEVGYNHRLSNILAALGRAQLRRLDAMIERRAGWRANYQKMLAIPGVRFLGGTTEAVSNSWLTALVVDSAVTGWRAQDLGNALAAVGAETRPVWKPLHQQPVFRDCAATLSGASDEIFANGLTLPSGSGLTDDEFALLEDTIGHFLEVR
jgi:dTDP-4-amino-4,6-dideoxygalactose transaminase